MAALALGYEGDEATLIAFMDEFKGTGRVEAYASLPEHVRQQFGHTLSKSTGRQYLQNFGNYARRVFGESFWIDQVLPAGDWDVRYPGVDVLAVTDVRYPNEAEAIRALEGEIWEVVRPGIESDGHASEQPLPSNLVDYRIANVGTLDDLSHSVARALRA